MQVQHFSMMLQSQSFRAICALNAGDVVTSRIIIQQCIRIYGFSFPPLFSTAPAAEARLRSDFLHLANFLRSAPRYSVDGRVMPVSDGQTEAEDRPQPACESSCSGGNGCASGQLQQRDPASLHSPGASPGNEQHAFAGNSAGMCGRKALNAGRLDQGTSLATGSSDEPHAELAARGKANSCDRPELSSIQTGQVALGSRFLDGKVDDTQAVSGSSQSLPAGSNVDANPSHLQHDKNARDAAESEQTAPRCLPAVAKSWENLGELGTSGRDESRSSDAERSDAGANAAEGSALLNHAAPADYSARALPSGAGPSGQGLSGSSGPKRARTHRLNGVELKYDDQGVTDFEQFHETELLVRLQAHLMAHGLSISKIMEMLRMLTMEIHMRVCYFSVALGLTHVFLTHVFLTHV
jgi:hypothetical protein